MIKNLENQVNKLSKVDTNEFLIRIVYGTCLVLQPRLYIN